MSDSLSGTLSDLVPEIREQICSFCKPGQLASLSLTNSGWAGPAERVLYRNIHLSPHSDKDEAFDLCVRTLTENTKKARLVRFLLAQLLGSDPELTDKQVGGLVVALKFMVNLRSFSFNLKTQPQDVKQVYFLEEVLKEGYFSLRSLHLESITDYAKVARYQPSLEAIGLFNFIQLASQHSMKNLNLEPEPTSTRTVLAPSRPLLFSYQWKHTMRILFVIETVTKNAFTRPYLSHIRLDYREIRSIGFIVRDLGEDTLKNMPEIVSNAVAAFSKLSYLALMITTWNLLPPFDFSPLHPILRAAPNLTVLSVEFGHYDGTEEHPMENKLAVRTEGKENVFEGLLSVAHKAREMGSTELRIISMVGIAVRWDEENEKWDRVELTGLLKQRRLMTIYDLCDRQHNSHQVSESS
ncbi:hypothetical protein EST38_g3959 [Candolleomyces aberdarensis]|uniref:Uncharacterized protein n=1 Tax=Candolleomyces aberdarensis TaxID=2316362 RepID=A0A4Q2DNQ8_9AGAR|nr:hypothetical protein EST38_g3959 [Candolleomyces aberdarensis]